MSKKKKFMLTTAKNNLAPLNKQIMTSLLGRKKAKLGTRSNFFTIEYSWPINLVTHLQEKMEQRYIPIYSRSNVSTQPNCKNNTLLTKNSCIENLVPRIWQTRKTPMTAIQSTVLTIGSWVGIFSVLRECCNIQ